MGNKRWVGCGIAALALVGLTACGGGSGSGLFNAKAKRASEDPYATANEIAAERKRTSSLLDLFTNADDPNTTVEVNKYIWSATLDILNFLPIESVDPFSGVIVTGYGTPPGGGRAYKATVLIQDPALDARSLKLALMTRSGPASPETVRAVEDAILTRARQLRIRDGKL
ncbi:DUF3576 domain-containing protein [Frigidibacter sp. ROC022]|uniref:DUF3576 domain-containing protein n=1 Tax=Frigidibacter sp. ROC022 TaxID=2971796 RepID=UPI00215B5D84|nr:DUF3576 domain-containing protein [Frigidibacter sp. ROC022]MCR8724946.1 DUF3576 domain-containing protein [Frigidibacter sp. ROC022]